MVKIRKTTQSTNPVRKITKVGKYSYGITFPKELVKNLKWRERQKVTVKQKGSKLIIEDWKK
jgi:antitoxin component of MazEF toxin-antitoxin module